MVEIESYNKEQLSVYEQLNLNDKIHLTNTIISEYMVKINEKAYISFSGGLDSTVMLHLIRKLFPNTLAVFSDTGLEYPEIRNFVKTFNNVTWVKPKKSFKDVLQEYGYPVISKRVSRYIWDIQRASDKNSHTVRLRCTGMNRDGKYMPTMMIPNKWLYLTNAPFKISDRCCEFLKKQPLNNFSNKSGLNRIIGLMSEESNVRKQLAKKYGVVVNKTNNSSYLQPIIFWSRQDILQYILNYNLNYCSIYGKIKNNNGILYTDMESRTGCMFCMFGIDKEPIPNRFQRMKISHPSQWDYCMNKLGCKKVLEFCNIPYE